MLTHSHTDLQAFAFTLITLCFCFNCDTSGFFVFAFCLEFTWLSSRRCLLCFPVRSGTAGSSAHHRHDIDYLSRGGCWLRYCFTPCQAIYWVASLLAQGEASSLHLLPLAARCKSRGLAQLCSSCARICQRGEVRALFAPPRASTLQFLPPNNRRYLHGFKNQRFLLSSAGCLLCRFSSAFLWKFLFLRS